MAQSQRAAEPQIEVSTDSQGGLLEFFGGAKRTRHGDFLAHGALVFAATMLVNVCGYIYHAAISRHLGVDEYGALYALVSAMTIVLIPGSIANTVIVKLAAEFRARDDEDHLRTFFDRMTVVVGIVSAGIVVCAWVFRGSIGAFLNVPGGAVGITGTLIGVALLEACLRSMLQGIQDFGGYALSAGIEAALKVILGIGLVWIGLRLAGALGGWLAGSTVGLLFTFALLWWRLRGPRAPMRVDWRRMAQIAYGAAAITVAATALGYGDVLLVKHFMSPQLAGLYASVSLGGKILLFVVGFVPVVLLPKAVARHAQGRSPLPVLFAALVVYIAISACGLLAYWFEPGLVLRSLVGPKFLAASHLVFGYGLAMVFLAGVSVVVSYKIALHRFDFAIPLLVITAAVLVTIVFRHANLAQVVQALAVGNALALLACLYRIGHVGVLVSKPEPEMAAGT